MKCHRADRVERAPDPLFIVLLGSLPHPHAPAGKAVLDLSNLSGVWFYLVFSERRAPSSGTEYRQTVEVLGSGELVLDISLL